MVEVNVSELLVDKFKEKNVKFVFGILSSGFVELGDILYDTDIKYVGARHEQWAGHMADAAGRLMGKPQIFLVPGGPGVTNGVTAIKTANINHSPMFVLSDGSTMGVSGKMDFQDIDGTSITARVAKHSQTVHSPDRVEEYFSWLYNIALTPLTGPVHLEVPRDILLMKTNYVKNLNASCPVYNSYPSEETVSDVIKIILQSSKPIIVAGEEINNETGREFLNKFVNELYIPVCAVHNNNDVMDNESVYMLGALGRLGSAIAMEALHRADVILALGTNMNPYTFSPYYGFKYNDITNNIIQVTLDSSNINRNFTTSKSLVCNPVEFLEVAVKILKNGNLNSKAPGFKNWFNSINRKDPPIFKGKYNNMVFETLFNIIPSKSIISLDAGSMSMVMLKWRKFGKSCRLLSSGNMGEVGFSISSAIGASLAKPGAPSFAFLGDGSFTMQMSALITAVEYNIPIKAIVFDNGAWGSEKAYQETLYNNRLFGSVLKNPDIAEVAKSLGVTSFRATDLTSLVLGLKDLDNSKEPSLLVINMENDFPTPVRSLDVVKRAYRGIY